jgi:hypothetical protein
MAWHNYISSLYKFTLYNKRVKFFTEVRTRLIVNPTEYRTDRFRKKEFQHARREWTRDKLYRYKGGDEIVASRTRAHGSDFLQLRLNRLDYSANYQGMGLVCPFFQD